MNIIDIVIIAILLFGMLSGMHKGMITSGLSLVGFIGAWFGAQNLYTRVVNLALGNSTLMAVLNQYLEPDSFFDTQAQAMTAVTDLVQGGESAITAIVDKIGGQFGFIKDAFSANLRTLAFRNLGINTVSEYFDQTFWTAIFNVAAFVLTFIALYLVILLIVNMLDKVICFPLLKHLDWLVGGLFGLFRAGVVVVLLLVIVPQAANTIAPELTQQMLGGSALYSAFLKIDIMQVGGWVTKLLMNTAA